MPTPEEGLNALQRAFELGCKYREDIPDAARAVGLPGTAFAKTHEQQRLLHSTWHVLLYSLESRQSPVSLMKLGKLRNEPSSTEE